MIGNSTTPEPARDNTTEASAVSTSSVNPVTSEPFDHITQLGQRIVHELGLSESTDTLGRWLAHRIAELISQAETAKGTAGETAAEQACQDAILAVWQRRSAWPRGWPPPAAKNVSELLNDASTPDATTWKRPTTPIGRLQDLHYQILACIVEIVATTEDSTEEEGWLEEFETFLDMDERALLQRIASVPMRLVMDSIATDPIARLTDLSQQYQSAATAIAELAHGAAQSDDVLTRRK